MGATARFDAAEASANHHHCMISLTTARRMSTANRLRLVMMRHGQSEWNLQNRFTGWADVPLTKQGVAEARKAGAGLREAGFTFDVAYTSVLKRAIKTLWCVQEEMNLMWLPVIKDWRLNERFYGGLTGLSKSETAEKFGEEQVKIWRRSYDVPPPDIDPASAEWPGHDPKYASVDPSALPLAESLKTCSFRVLPWYDSIKGEILAGKNVLIVAHGNSLRALIKEIDSISDEDILGIDIPTGVPLVYELELQGDKLVPVKSDRAAPGLSGYYIGDQAAIEAQMAAVAAQGKASK